MCVRVAGFFPIVIFSISVVKPFKFTRDSGCLARDEFLLVFKGDHILIYMYIFAIVLLLGTVLHRSS